MAKDDCSCTWSQDIDSYVLVTDPFCPEHGREADPEHWAFIDAGVRQPSD